MTPVNTIGRHLALAISFVTLCLFFSCKKTDTINTVPEQTVDFSKKVSASVSGFVINENNSPVAGATVQYGESFFTTDQYGYFEVKNATVIENAGVLTVKKVGYFNSIKTFLTQAGKKNFCRIKMIPKTNSGSVDAISGGNITLSNGLNVFLPASGIIDATTKAPYSGIVSVSSFWIDPAAGDIYKIMPGDLRGINTNGSIRLLTTFGMAAVELTGNSGQLLQIADGKKATLTFPLPNTIAAEAPATIPLWYFDETKGLWIEEGMATKTGNSYVGDVAHFTYWNCDLPNATVPLTFTVVNSNGTPLENKFVDIVPLTSNSWSHTGGYTDGTGYVNVLVTANASYVLNISNDCLNDNVHSQQFSVGTTALKLGNITIPESNITTVSGTVECNGVHTNEDSYVMIYRGAVGYKNPVKNDGSFSFETILCGSSEAITLIAVNPSTLNYSNTITYTIQNGNNSIPPINTCQNSVQQQSGTFINYTVNGTSYSLISPIDSVYHLIDTINSNPNYGINGYNVNGLGYVSLGYQPVGVVMGSSTPLLIFVCQVIPGGNYTFANNVSPMIHFTEYGNVGGFISGNVTGSQFNTFSPNLVYDFSCSFRVRRVR